MELVSTERNKPSAELLNLLGVTDLFGNLGLLPPKMYYILFWEILYTVLGARLSFPGE